MSSLSEALASTKGPGRGPKCRFGKWVRGLDPDVRADVEAALADPLIEHAHLARALNQLGGHVTRETIGRHRNGECVTCGWPRICVTGDCTETPSYANPREGADF